MELKLKTPPVVMESLEDANQALANADCAELHRLFLISREKHGAVLKAMEAIVEHYAGSQLAPRYGSQSTDAVVAMKDVALAAIELAKQVSK
jgi:hypothetical protein